MSHSKNLNLKGYGLKNPSLLLIMFYKSNDDICLLGTEKKYLLL